MGLAESRKKRDFAVTPERKEIEGLPEQAPKAALPPFVSPQLATLVSAAPAGDEWVHEMKFDGFRILARLRGGKAQLLTRTGQDWTARFSAIAHAIEKLPAGDALIDGEATIVLRDGRTSFQALQNQGAGTGGTLVYFAFDLLHLDGHDVRPLPLEARKQLLARLLGRSKAGTVRYTEHVAGSGPAFFAEACKAGLEGIISKRRNAPYRTGRGGDWLKTKCVKRQELVIGGFTEPSGTRKGLGALLVGFYDGGALRYAGKVGTGYTQKSALALRARLETLEQGRPPFSPPPKPVPKAVHWVAPKLLAEVGFTEMTADGKLRHPSFQGLRDDKRPGEVTREVAAATDTIAAPKAKSRSKAKAPASAEPAVALTHPERVLFPAGKHGPAITKRELAAYYEAIADHAVPEVAGRPLTLVRCPDGVGGQCFFMKHAGRGMAASLGRVHIREQTKSGEYLVADSLAGLIGLVQMSVLEIHTWNSRADALEAPDRVVFDLDPGPKVGWKLVVSAAEAVRARLRKLGFAGFVKATGGKGLHVVVPLVPGADWPSCLAFTRLVAESLVAEDPDHHTTALPKEGREAKILIDYYRNRRGSTSIAAYSTRARAGAPVAAPLDWGELADFSPDRPFTLASLPARLARLRRDPWRDFDKSRKPLAQVLEALPPGKRPRAAPTRRSTR